MIGDDTGDNISDRNPQYCEMTAQYWAWKNIKDTEYIVQFLINMLFYATPILYPTTLFPERVRWILCVNPLTELIEAYRDIFMYHQLPSLLPTLYLLGITIVVFFIGLLIFRKLEKGFAEEI